MADVTKRFQFADQDKDGRINLAELQRVLESFSDVQGNAPVEFAQHWYTPEEVQAVMAQYDSDGSGSLDLREFGELVSDGLLLERPLAAYEAAFRAADVEGTGRVGPEALCRLLCRMGSAVTEEQVSAALHAYGDCEGEGCVVDLDFGQFLRVFRDDLFALRQVLAYIGVGDAPDGAAGFGERGSSPMGSMGGAASTSIVGSEAELDAILKDAPRDQLVVLFASFTWGAEDTAMQGPYQALADHYALSELAAPAGDAPVPRGGHATPAVVFYRVYGNLTSDTKTLIRERLRVRATPAFLLFRGCACVESLVDYSGADLEKAVRRHARATRASLPPQLLHNYLPAL